jgi:hypothetical protein
MEGIRKLLLRLIEFGKRLIKVNLIIVKKIDNNILVGNEALWKVPRVT